MPWGMLRTPFPPIFPDLPRFACAASVPETGTSEACHRGADLGYPEMTPTIG